MADLRSDVRVGAHVIRRVILFEGGEGVYVFPCTSCEDGSAAGDDWYPTLAEAEGACAQRYGVRAEDIVVGPGGGLEGRAYGVENHGVEKIVTLKVAEHSLKAMVPDSIIGCSSAIVR